ncbi:MAG: glycogen/starch synthase [Tannerella sp.]|jgi:glycosyltransferase involved in cell wall biosynthesis|nr:glycogen/starch synthase [Tannerella sp.]
MLKMIEPDYIFESSWEVCNKAGGIYTVLSTKALTLQKQFGNRLLFIGPDFGAPNPDFEEDRKLFSGWRKSAERDEVLRVRTGRWAIHGNPLVVLVDFKPFFPDRDKLYYSIWETFGVDSSRAYGDYDDSCLFAYAAAKVIRHFYQYHHLEDKNVVAHFHEWTTGMGALYLRKHLPAVATVFTAHASVTGRSIAGNGKPLYGYMDGYNGDQMAFELHVESKHSLEKQTARHADCFTTVSEITATECRQLLEKAPDVVMPNGFEPDFVPASGELYAAKRRQARSALLRVAGKLSGCAIRPEAFLVSISGRYEYRNKGIDVFIDVMNTLRRSDAWDGEIVAFVMVPAGVYAPRADLRKALDDDIETTEPMQAPFLTHWLQRMDEDRVTDFIRHAGFTNAASEKVKIIFVPCYVDGRDGIFDKTYYDLLIGMDCTVFPSYYEPWGYTPMESIAFGIPTVTTDLAGFGLWAKTVVQEGCDIDGGVAVMHRTDDNYSELVNGIAARLCAVMRKSKAERDAIAQNCLNLAAKAEWSHFITFYREAYAIALKRAKDRIQKELY